MACCGIVHCFREQQRARAVGALSDDLVIETASVVDPTRTDREHDSDSSAQAAARFQPRIGNCIEPRRGSEK